jgi:hypothetical protein
VPTTDVGHRVDVNVGACRCPTGPHAPLGDTVSLAPKLTVPMGAALTLRLRGAHPDLPSVQGDLVAGYLAPSPIGAITGWSFVDEKGEPMPITQENIDTLLPWENGGMEVAEKADELYSSDLLAPFVKRLSKLSNTGQTDDSTSASLPFGTNTPMPPRSSSRRARAGKRSGARAR